MTNYIRGLLIMANISDALAAIELSVIFEASDFGIPLRRFHYCLTEL
jgi:hypothetical protein